MRYDTPISFVKEAEKHYDPEAGEWIQEEPVRTKKYANVTHMGADRQQAVFGDVKANRLVVRLQRVYGEAYDLIEIGGKAYHTDTERLPSVAQSLVVMQNNG
ncbi:hypothetical protein INP51_06415 [Blautia liquoris]|uniref:Phage head-tail joining protein n=1 Tax=Blautia liquoris TaxID=2779518 RepID=A0A7M2RMK1_9FIRM|nr:hypothetical protein [Blautia liquoris]QOV20570.1 hypothetical protein INP51_06415 [Blautia liquoris]